MYTQIYLSYIWYGNSSSDKTSLLSGVVFIMVVYGGGDGIRGDDVLMADVIWYATRMYGFLQIQFVTRFSNVSFIFFLLFLFLFK